jgi:endoglucanase
MQRLAIICAVSLSCLPVVAHAQARAGVNLAGCAVGTDGSLCPMASEVNAYADQGFSMFRIGFKETVPMTKVTPSVDAALARNATVLLDRHEFKWPSIDDQVAFWTARIGKYKGNQKVIIDLMNEPKGFNSTTQTNDFNQWVLDTRAIIAGLRKNGISNPIAVEWPQYSAIFRFDKGEAATKGCESALCSIVRMGGFQDDNVILEPHGYLDKGSSGTSSTCDKYTNIAKFVAPARKYGFKAILGETAFGNYKGVPNSCKTVAAQMQAEIRAASDVFMGVTYWGAGREWQSSYIFAIQPKGQTLNTAYARQLLGR